MIKIGIDPDIKKSGLAVIEGSKAIQVTLHTHFDLLETITKLSQQLTAANKKFVFVVEKGEENNGHLFNARSRAKKYGLGAGLKTASDTGKNFRESEIIIEYCQRNNIPYKIYVPTTAKWTESFCRKSVQNLPKQMGEEKRDAVRAAMLI